MSLCRTGYVCIYTYICLYVYICLCMCVCIYIYKHTCKFVYIHIYTHCMYEKVHMYTYMHTMILINQQTSIYASVCTIYINAHIIFVLMLKYVEHVGRMAQNVSLKEWDQEKRQEDLVFVLYFLFYLHFKQLMYYFSNILKTSLTFQIK